MKIPFPTVAATLTTLGAMAISGLAGVAATLLYGGFIGGGPKLSLLIGALFGAGAGVPAGVLWCQLMHRSTEEWVEAPELPVGRILGFGTVCGIGAGLLATGILHLGLQLFSARHDAGAYLIGAIFGAPAGALGGLLYGAGWVTVVRKARARPTTPA